MPLWDFDLCVPLLLHRVKGCCLLISKFGKCKTKIEKLRPVPCLPVIKVVLNFVMRKRPKTSFQHRTYRRLCVIEAKKQKALSVHYRFVESDSTQTDRLV